MTRLRSFLAALSVLLAMPAADAQAGPLQDRVKAALASPQVVIAHGEDLHIDLRRRNRAINLASVSQERVRMLERDLETHSGHLATLLETHPVDEAQALAALEQVQRVEAQIRREHLMLWIRINALLTTSERQRAIALGGGALPAPP